MKKIFIIILVLMSVQSFGQKTYFRRLAANGSIDSGYIKFFTDSVFSYADNSFVSLSVESFEGQFNPVLPNGFSNFKKGADGVYTNYSQRIDFSGVASKPTTLSGYGVTDAVPNTLTVNGKALNTNISITASDVGLGNVNNTSDANKPISSATQTALNGKQATLVSATNIKTVNGNTLLGSGDLVVGGGATTSSSGVAASPTASGTQTVTHNLGRTPSIIRIYGIGTFTSNAAATPTPFSMGVFSSSGNTCVYMRSTGTTTQVSQSSTAFSVFISTSSGNFVSGVIQNVGANSFDIVWTETGTAVAQNFLWEAQ